MNYKFVVYSIGKLLQVLALVLFVPATIAVIDIWPGTFFEILYNRSASGFFLSILISMLIGTVLSQVKFGELKGNLVREGFSIVTFGWIILTLFGAIPLFIYSHEYSTVDIFSRYTNAFFEIMSGFTTTGSTIMTDIESLPRSILFWRSLTHWLGGMGIVTLALSIFPAFGVSAYQMFRGEVPGPTAERLRPRLNQTAIILWGVYALLTLFEAILLHFGGMTIFDAICHAFGTMATGGFSTKNSSVAAYQSAYIDWVIIVFMFLAGMNFLLHYQIIFHRNFKVLKEDHEFRFYLTVVIGAIIVGVIVLSSFGLGQRSDIENSFRHNKLSSEQVDNLIATENAKISTITSRVRYMAFQVISIITTTGFCTADYDVWPNILRTMLVILMFFGGSAGSTGGGIKMVRIMVLLKTGWREVKTMVQPRLISPVKIAEKALEDKQVANISGFFILFILLYGIFTLLMSLILSDFTTALTSVSATICNIGPGLSGVGATENYNWIPNSGKWILSLAMLMGRLEIYTVIIALLPFTLKK